MIKKINACFDNKSLIMFYVFLFLQPVLDLLVSVFNHFSISPFMLYIIRMLPLVYALYYLFFIKKKNIKYLILLIIYYIVFLLINLITKPNGKFLYELQAITKIIYFPILLIYLLNLFENKEFEIKNLYIILCIYLIFIFFPNLFNIGFKSYDFDKVGSIGFFFSANVIGNIISILFPISIGYLVENKKILQSLLFLPVYIYVILSIGTKAPLLLIIIIILYFAILYFLSTIKSKKYKNIIFISIISALILILLVKYLPETSFYKNLIIHAKNKDIHSIKDLLDIRKMDEYIFSARLKTFSESLDIYIHSSFLKKIFGIGYVINGVIIKTSEMDFLIMLIHHGIVGFILINYIFIKKVFEIIRIYTKNLKSNITDIKKSYLIISVLTILLNVLLVGHVLDTPSVSIFVATIIAITYCKKGNKNER